MNPQRNYDRLVAAKLASGFVIAPAAPAVPQIACAVHRNRELEAAIAAQPDDVASYLVYGDWLQEQGDRRGELVHVQHVLHATNDPALSTLDEELRATYAHAWLGGLVATNAHRVKLEWRLGFVDTARVDASPSEPALAALVTALLASPAGCLLRMLVLRARSAGELAEALDALQSGFAYAWSVTENLCPDATSVSLTRSIVSAATAW
jgi:uncharacterized protein (TIGR02996 family)